MHGPLSFNEKSEFIRFASQSNIKIVNLCHIPEDGRLKTLSFSVTEKGRLDGILDFGERVDGSSLFSFIEPGNSDIYVRPRLDKAFVNPFATVPTINVLCDYLDEQGKPLKIAPRNILARAEEKLFSSSKIVLKALAELEFYVMSEPETKILFPAAEDKNYHESAPFARFENLRNEVLTTLADRGIATKYGHSEVGKLADRNGTIIEQHEIEFTIRDLRETAETITLAKWIIRSICEKHGVSASFSPKIAMEHAGTGMHIHLCGYINDRNVVSDSNRSLTADARKMIGGILKFAPSLAAFGNPTPVSYLRFIARKESPMHVCWGARNRLALIRIPLWWSFAENKEKPRSHIETFEYRAPDAFANAYLLFAGIAVAVDYGMRNPDEALRTAEDLRVETADDEKKKTDVLPCSCEESAKNLEKDRRFYEAEGVFPSKLIDKTIENLKTYKDKGLWKELANKPNEVERLLKQYLHYG
jgi:glutamine synthetase